MAKCNWCGSDIPNGDFLCSKCKADVNKNKIVNSVNAKDQNEYEENAKSLLVPLIKLIGIIDIIFGFIALLAIEDNKLIYFIGGVVSGILIFGFGEMLRLLHSINDKIKK